LNVRPPADKLDGVLQPLNTFAAISVLCLPIAGSEFAAEPEPSHPAPNPALAPRWEDEIANGYLPYHQLTTNDFAIKENLDPQIGYVVQGFVHYYYTTLSKMAQSGIIYAYVKDWTVFSGFNKNLSGRRSKLHGMKDELIYAQAILDLNELYARRLAALEPGQFPSASGTTYPEAQRQLENRIEQMCNLQLGQMRKEGEALANATHNGQNKKRVRELAAAIKKRLDQLPPRASPSPTDSPARTGPPVNIPPPATLSPSPRN
jgi:hypothetical protein